MADDFPDDDATRIYRPYGSPPPDASPDQAPDARSPDPFAPTSPTAEAAPDPFAPDPFTPDPFTPDPFAPDSPPVAARADAFAPDAPDAPAGPTPDPFAPAPPPSASGAQPPDPFRPPPPPGRDPFAPPPPASPSHAAPSGTAPPAPDPFAPPSAPDPFEGRDPFGTSVAGASADPFAAPPDDPFTPSAATPDPFAPSAPAGPPPAAPSPFDLSAPDPFAAPPALPTADPVPARASDPFAPPAGTGADDPFADLQGPSPGGAPSYADDSRVYATARHAEVDLPDVFGTERTLAGAFTPVVSLILQIRASQHLGDPNALRQRVEALLSEATRSARELGVPDADVSEAEFCLVAFLDEAILGSDWPGRDAWSAQPLQLTHYDRYDAGEWFFDRLKALLDAGGTRTAVLEVYYLCLALGFKGRYAIQGREVLRRLVDDLHGRLERAAGAAGVLAPRGTSREVPAEAETGGLPSWALWIGAAVLVALLYLGLSLSLSSVADETARELETLTASS